MNRARHNSRGSTLLAALCFTAVLALGVTSYMAVCYRSLAVSSRSLQLERGWQLAELGLEDALWSLNQAGVTGFTTDNGWTLDGTTATKALSGFGYENGVTGSIDITVENVGTTPGERTVTVASHTTLADGQVLTRHLRSTATPMPLFVNALAGISVSDKISTQVRFYNAGNVDSYRSADGAYGDTNSGWGAVISSNDKVNLNKAQIKGYVAIDSSASNALTYTTSATLKGADTAANVKIDPLRLSSSTVQPIFDVTTPSGAGTILASYPGSMTLGDAADTTPRIYYASDFYLSGSTTITIAGPVQLVVYGDLVLAGKARIVVDSQGSLEIFLGRSLETNSTNDYGFINDSNKPERLAILGTGGSANAVDIDQTGTSASKHFYGVIYTPEATINLRGTGEYFGAFMGKRINVRETMKIHYDASLQAANFAGIAAPYGVSQREELFNP